MPKIYEYFGLIFYFYSNEHIPMHIHVRYAEYENKAEFVFENGKLKKIVFKKIIGKQSLPEARQKDVIKFIKVYIVEIIEKWTQFYILHKKPKAEKITTKI